MVQNKVKCDLDVKINTGPCRSAGEVAIIRVRTTALEDVVALLESYRL